MPEGDSLHRVALRLRSAFVDRELVAVEAPTRSEPIPSAGERVVSVDAIGKWLRIEFSGGRVLLTHLRMNGRWHLYRRGERWRAPRGAMRVRLVTDDAEAVCFAAPVVEFHTTASAARRVAYLGPDLTSAAPDIDDALAAFAAFDPTTTIAEVLLDQRVAAGVGNVYRSEVCWFERLDPFTPVRDLDMDARRRLLERAHRLLRSNLGPGRRTTVDGGLAVYGRTGRACRRCGVAIRSAVVGVHARRVHWCPGCQRRPPAAALGRPDDDRADDPPPDAQAIGK